MVDDPFYSVEILMHPVPKGCTNLVVGRGSKTPSVVFIGEAPGSEEDKTGFPFVGKSGRILDTWIKYWDLSEDDYAILNTVKFFPQDATGKPRPPTDLEKDEWRPVLKKQIDALAPKLIITLGAVATNEMTDNTKPQMEITGTKFEVRHYYGGKIPVMPLAHPSFYLRNGKAMEIDKPIKTTFQFIHEKLNRPKILVLDIETDNKLDIDTAKVVACGFYSYVYPKDYLMTGDIVEMQQIIDRHTHLIGYNIREFDLPILKNNGVESYGKVVVDLYKGITARGRKEVMKLKDLPDNKLDTLVAYLKLGNKIPFDFKILEKSVRTAAETRQLGEYLHNDILITRKLYDWWCDWAAPFEPYVSEENRWRKTYLTCSVASYAYKAICYATNREEDYLDEDEKVPEDTFEGGFVSADQEKARGKILLYDFASLYPHNFFQGNLFSPVTPEYKGPVFKKNDFYPDLTGVYKADKMGDVETALKRFYRERVKFKIAKDSREYALKIVLNSSYGAGTCRTFKSIYNPTIGPDTTYIGRQNIKYMRKLFQEKGFILLYSDTDSLYIQLPEGKTQEEADQIVRDGIAEIKKWLPFPSDTFKMSLETPIKYFQCFWGSDNKLLKKLYLFVTDKNEIVIKGLPFIKSNATILARRVFDRIKPEIISTLHCFFSESYIEKLIREEVEKDFMVAAKTFTVKAPGKYKIPTQLDCQIAQRYGAGKILLIKNKLIGVGKDVRYCTIEEAKCLKFDDLDLSTTREELHFFIKKPSLSDFNETG